MSLQYVVSTGSVTLVAATVKYMIELPTTTMPLRIFMIEIMSGATSAGSLTVELCTHTVTGTGTTVTPQKWGEDQSVAAQVGTVKVAHTVAPSSPVAIMPSWLIPLPGMYSVIYPSDLRMYQPPSTLRNFRVTSTVAFPCRMNVYFEH